MRIRIKYRETEDFKYKAINRENNKDIVYFNTIKDLRRIGLKNSDEYTSSTLDTIDRGRSMYLALIFRGPNSDDIYRDISLNK